MDFLSPSIALIIGFLINCYRGLVSSVNYQLVSDSPISRLDSHRTEDDGSRVAGISLQEGVSDLGGNVCYLAKNNENLPDLEDSQLPEIRTDFVTIVTTDGSRHGAGLENDASAYRVEEHPRSIWFKFKSGAQCAEVMCKDKIVWKHTSDFGNEFPKEIVFEKFERKARLNFYNFYLVYEYSGNDWHFKSRAQLDVAPPSELKIVTYADKEGSNFKENDKTQYALKDEGYVLYYEFLEGAKCSRLDYGKSSVWEYEGFEDNAFPKSLCFRTDLSLMFVEFDGLVYMYKCGPKQCKFVVRESEVLPASALKFIGQNGDDSSDAVDLDPLDLEVSHQGFGVEYKFKKSVKCMEIKYGDESVWKYGFQDSGTSCPEKLFFNFYAKMITLEFPHFSLIYKYTGRFWSFLVKADVMRFLETNFTFVGDDSAARSKSDGHDYDLVRCPNNEVYFYLFRDGFEFREIKYKDRTVWKGQKPLGGGSKVMTLDLHSKMLMVDLGKEMYLYAYAGTWIFVFSTPDALNLENGTKMPSKKSIQSKEISVARPSGKRDIAVNLIKIVSSDWLGGKNRVNDPSQYYFLEETYGYKYSFKYGTKCESVEYDDRVVWKHDPKEHGNRYPDQVVFHLEDGVMTVQFTGHWYYVYGFDEEIHNFVFRMSRKPLTKAEQPSEVKFITMSPFIPGKFNENDNAAYEVNRYSRQGSADQYDYYFHQGTKCVEIYCFGELVWKHAEKDPYPRALTFTKVPYSLSMSFDNGFVGYQMVQGKWVVSNSKLENDRGVVRGDQDRESDLSKQKSHSSAVLDDALVLVLLLSVLAIVIVSLILVLAAGFLYLFNKKRKADMQPSYEVVV